MRTVQIRLKDTEEWTSARLEICSSNKKSLAVTGEKLPWKNGISIMPCAGVQALLLMQVPDTEPKWIYEEISSKDVYEVKF